MAEKREPGTASRVVIGDIAQELGVSVSTVSRVLNGHPDVAPSTRQRVLDQIRRRGFASNRVARGATEHTTGLVGIITPEVTGNFFSEFVAGIVEELDEHSARPVLVATHGDEGRELELLKYVSHGATDGAILILPRFVVEHLVPLLYQGYPSVVIDPAVPVGDAIPVVTASNAAGARVATEHLIARGHRRIGVITGRAEEVASTERLAGYRDALKDAGLPDDDTLIRAGAYEFEDGHRCALELFALSPPPTAIFAFNDAMASGVIRAAFECHKTLPDMLSIVGFDDSETAHFVTPPLTSVRQPLRDMGRTAVRVLYDLIHGRSLGTTRFVLATQLHVRGSTADAGVMGRA